MGRCAQHDASRTHARIPSIPCPVYPIVLLNLVGINLSLMLSIMDNTTMEMIATPYASGVSWNILVPGLGNIKVFGGHLAPAHKQPLGVSEIRSVVNNHDVILADFNAANAQLVKTRVVDRASDSLTRPSYLPHIADDATRTRPTQHPWHSQPTFVVPCFDDVLSVRAQLVVRPFSLSGAPVLPVVTRGNPRDLMRALGMPSDHAPMAAVVMANAPAPAPAYAPETLRGAALCITYNVADPVFWGPAFPPARAGFDMAEASQAQRERALVAEVDGYLQEMLRALLVSSGVARCTAGIIALQEVPHRLRRELVRTMEQRGLLTAVSQMHCSESTGLRADQASWVVVGVLTV
jgi:hypothetical protein